ncbi:MAG TPA: glutaredoxin family protein [Pseudogracilibacillus sp.]|nr:glutaredoxin family protein [Pseudogracilibacillus sp.]
MLEVTFFTKEKCLLCDEAETILETVQLLHPFQLHKVDIYEDDVLLEKYQLMIPVIEINETCLTSNDISFERIEAAIKNNET